jgi:prepilin-type N-terminal cleavage/methylation domain-containing protein
MNNRRQPGLSLMKMNNSKQSGFTLVEIAIVLVVIGLLLGGILKGQQLINSARVRNLADQNSGVQAAYYGFIDRFRNLPGDMTCTAAVSAVGAAVSPNNCTTVVGGNGNGRIDSVVEAGAVWSHLSVAGFLTGTYSGITPDANTYRTGVANGLVPANAFQGPILLGHSNDYMEGAVRAGVVRLIYSFGGNIPVPLLRDLDQKLDDGNGVTGVLRSAAEVTLATPPGSVFAPITDFTTGTSTSCLANNTWNVDSSNQTCNAIFLY